METNQTDSDDSEEHANQFFNESGDALLDTDKRHEEHNFVLVDLADLDEGKISAYVIIPAAIAPRKKRKGPPLPT